MTCPRCGASVGDESSACAGCGMPTTFMDPGDALETTGDAVEPEVLDSLDDAERTRFGAPPQPVGCTLGPGCGCIGLPLAVLAGVVVSSLMALLWVLSLGRVPFTLAGMARNMRRRGRG